MVGADFYRIAEATLISHLAPAGWKKVDRGSFVLREPDGMSRLAVGARKGFERFSVFVTFYPQDAVDLIAGFGYEDYSLENAGFLCGPYLTPAGVFRRPREWPCRTKAQLTSSLEKIIQAIDTVAFPWLSSLRDPRTLAEAADPISALLCGYAWERAGDMARANERYLDMWNRLEQIREQFPRLFPKWKSSMKREYVFLARRLNRENDVSRRFAVELDAERDAI